MIDVHRARGVHVRVRNLFPPPLIHICLERRDVLELFAVPGEEPVRPIIKKCRCV